MKKWLCVLLVAILFTLSACGSDDTKPTGGTNGVSQSVNAPEGGYGRVVLTLGDIKIRCGDTVQELADAGLEFNKDWRSATLGAGQSTYMTAQVESGAYGSEVRVEIVNPTDRDCFVGECRSYLIHQLIGASIGVESEDDLIALYGEADRYMDDEINGITYGNELNFLACEIDELDGTVSVDVLYLENLLEEGTTPTRLGLITQLLTGDYFDATVYQGMATADVSPYAVEKLAVTFNGETLTLGDGGDNGKSLTEKGFSLDDASSDGAMSAGARVYCSSPSGFIGELSGITLANLSDEEASLEEANLVGFHVSNPYYAGTVEIGYTPAVDLKLRSLDFCGIGYSSTMTDIFEVFGTPGGFGEDLFFRTWCDFYYEIEDENGLQYTLSVQGDVYTGEWIHMTVTCN